MSLLSRQEILSKLIPPEEAEKIINKLEGYAEIRDRNGITKVFKEDIRGRILIYPFNHDCLQSSSYDFRVGERVISLTFGKEQPPEKFRLQPKEYAHIQTLEYIAIPVQMMGFIHSKVGKVLDGLSHISTKVDPGFFGHLTIGVYNNIHEAIPLPKGESFCAVSFIELKDSSDQPYFSKGEHLGKKAWDRRISTLEPIKRKEKGEITPDLMRNLFDTYGPPFDVVDGMFYVMGERFEKEMRDKILPRFESNLVNKIYGEMNKREANLWSRVVSVLIVGFVALIITVVIALVIPLLSVALK